MPEFGERPLVVLDFDGTITQRDVVDAILEQYAGRGWLRLEEKWRAGQLGSRECLAGQMAFVEATRAQIDALLDDIELDRGFVPLLQTLADHRVTAHIVSDGFDYCVRRILGRLPRARRRLLRGVSVRASHLEPHGTNRWRTAFPFFEQPCAHGCATCKPAVMDTLNPDGAPTVFVGDGLSDRYVAAAADLVFAKDTLAVHCAEHGVPHVRYETLADVGAYIAEGLRCARVWRRLPAARVRA